MKWPTAFKKHRWLVPVAAVALLVVAVVAWRALRPTPPPVLATAPATRGDIEYTVIATGTLEATKMVSVGAQVSGQIKSLKVELGDRVKAGELIAEIDSITQTNNLRNAEAALGNITAQRAVQVANLRQAELAFERQKTMLEQEATSKADYEAAEASLASTKAQIQALDAQIVQRQTERDTARANLGYTKITAPMEGTVVAIVAKEGQTVNANQTAPTIVKLADLDTITVSAEISEADVIKVKPGQTVYFTILGDARKRYYAKLRTIEPAPESIESEGSGNASSSSSGSSSSAVYYNALFEVPNKEGELRISMTAQVFVVLDEAKDVLTVPASALGRRGRGGVYTVMVTDAQGRPQPREVKIGINNNITAQVLSGLNEGDKVVVGEANSDPKAVSDTQRNMMRRRPPFM